MWHTKNAFFCETQFWSHCYTVVSYQALFRLSVYKIPAVYLSGAKKCVFARYATLVPRLLVVWFSVAINLMMKRKRCLVYFGCVLPAMRVSVLCVSSLAVWSVTVVFLTIHTFLTLHLNHLIIYVAYILYF